MRNATRRDRGSATGERREKRRSGDSREMDGTVTTPWGLQGHSSTSTTAILFLAA